MIRRLLAGAISREAKGLGRLPWVLAIALLALLLPQVSSAQEMLLTTFSSPPPGTPTIAISIGGKAKLIDRIVVTDAVEVTCGPFAYQTDAGNSVTVSQVVLKKVVSASGSLSGQVPCDNVPHSYHAVISLPSGSSPFHTGSAVVEVNINVCGYTQNTYQWICIQKTKARNVSLQ